MKRILLLLLLTSVLCRAQVTLSNRAQISVITFGPGQEAVYTAFGHSAIRVFDPTRAMDIAYNYGVFNFNKPNFYLDFARGYNYYKVEAQDYRELSFVYRYFNRYIHEQVLNLSQTQKQQLFNYLQTNALPQNQEYLYDYFYNNCATKIRDVVKTVLKDSVQFDGSYITTDYTIRELTDLYLTYQPWGDLGIDICLGLPMDKKASPYEYMFLPEYIEKGFDHAVVFRNGKSEPLVKVKYEVHTPAPENYSNGFFQPLYVFILLLIVASLVTYRDFKRRKITKWFDIVMFSVLGLLGWLLLLLWTATDHKAAANNLNILWALPTHLIAAIAIVKQPSWLKKYFKVSFIFTLLVLVAWFFLPQKLHYTLIPIAMISCMRSWVQFKLLPQK